MTIILLVLYITASTILAYFGNKKRIGWPYALFFSLSLTPIIGIILVILSPLKNNCSAPKDSKYNKICGWIFVFFSIYFFKELFFSLPLSYTIWGLDISRLMSFIGCIGLTIYFFERTKRNNEMFKEISNQP